MSVQGAEATTLRMWDDKVAGQMDKELGDFLMAAASRAPGNEVQLTIRELLQKWGAQKRGYWYVQEIRQDLEKHGLVTDPPFTDGTIDTVVRLHNPKAAMRMLTERALTGGLETSPDGARGSSAAQAHQEVDSSRAGVALTFGHLRGALFGDSPPPMMAVSQDDTLTVAQSKMMRYNYSQMPVMAGPKSCKGVVSWESIARTLTHKPDATLKDCIIPVEVVRLRDDVLANVPKITENQFVLVQDEDRTMVGIVTTADLSAAFEVLSGPFLMIGLVENRLRVVAESRLDEHVIREACGTARAARAVDGLTLSELKGLFEVEENWARLGWKVDRRVFCNLLQEVVEIRNQVMHFRGAVRPGPGLASVRNLLVWLDFLVD